MKKLISFVLTGFMVVGLAGCSGGVSQEEYDRVLSLYEGLQEEIDKLGQVNINDSIDEAAIEVLGDLLNESYTTTIANEEYLQYSVQIETDRDSIRTAYDDLMFQLNVIQALLNQKSESTAGQAIGQYSAFYIKAVDSDGMTVFEVSYHPNAQTIADISIGATYLEEATQAILNS